MSDDNYKVEQVHMPRPECPDCRMFAMEAPADVNFVRPANPPKDVVAYDAYLCCGRLLLMPVFERRIPTKKPIPVISEGATVDLKTHYRRGAVPEDAIDVYAWYGAGGNVPVGPLRAKAVMLEGGRADVWILEEQFLKNIEQEECPYFMPMCERLQPQGLRYNDYAWSPVPASRFDRV